MIVLNCDNLHLWPAYQRLLDEGKVAFDACGRLRYRHGAPVGRMILVRVRKDSTPVYQESAEGWFDPGSQAAHDFV